MKWICVIIMTFGVLSANPIAVDFINEFQVAPTSQEHIEFQYCYSDILDTLQNDSFPLLGMAISTPGGTAFIDHDIYTPFMGYTIIDSSVLNGGFSLPDDCGFILVEDGMFGAVYYPNGVPAPPINYSIARFGCWGWYDDYYRWYYRITDLYLDATPTFGEPNDDYPGSIFSGHVFGYYGEPLYNAQIVATKHEEWPSGCGVINPPQYPTCCTTYTASDGSYAIDSLLPSKYDVIASCAGYLPETLLTATLRALKPITNLDFHLSLIGVSENAKSQTVLNSYVYPNPFSTAFTVVLAEPCAQVKVFDVAGKLCSEVNNAGLSTSIKIDCAALPKGIYFVSTPKQMLKVVKR